jgi:hypothetical protein
MKWKIEKNISENWNLVELRPEVQFRVELLSGRAEMCFGLFSCYGNATPRPLEIGEPRYAATSDHERYLYLRGKGRVTVEEIG